MGPTAKQAPDVHDQASNHYYKEGDPLGGPEAEEVDQARSHQGDRGARAPQTREDLGEGGGPAQEGGHRAPACRCAGQGQARVCHTLVAGPTSARRSGRSAEEARRTARYRAGSARHQVVPPGSGRGVRAPARRRGPAGGHAHGQRQVAALSADLDGRARRDGRGQSADRADQGSARQDGLEGRERLQDRLDAHRQAASRGQRAGQGARRKAPPDHARAHGGSGVPHVPPRGVRRRRRVAVRRRRGALRLAVGT